MRMHIELADELVAQMDQLTGPRGRSSFVHTAIERALEQERRWSSLESAADSIEDCGHDHDSDAAGWVRDQRGADPRHAG
ncbi:MAG TPA: hypothetical protein VF635_18295 [Propionibacteriaceae bacterium]